MATAKLATAVMLAVTTLVSAQARSVRRPIDRTCLKGDTVITVSGRLTVQLFAGQPNYESIRDGDAEERTFILELPKSVCLDDGGDFADPKVSFNRVQVSSVDDALMKVFRAAVGKRVTVTGEGFAAHTGHHHAPLVVLAEKVTVQ